MLCTHENHRETKAFAYRFSKCSAFSWNASFCHTAIKSCVIHLYKISSWAIRSKSDFAKIAIQTVECRLEAPFFRTDTLRSQHRETSRSLSFDLLTINT
jgi:hypothetical protein